MVPTVISSSGTEIDHQVCGSGDLTLLFVHGWCIDKSYWSYQSDGFCSQYKVVTIDLPGYGQSGRNRDDWSIEQFGKDINNVINLLQLENVVLVGHSMGGDIILETALQNDKVIALVGVDNFKDVGMEFNPQLQEEIDGFLQILQQNYTEVATAYAEGALFHPETDPMVVKRVIDDIQTADSTIAVASLQKLFDYTQNESRKLSKLKQKLYLINSSYTPTDTVALKKTGVEFELLHIQGTGHYPMVEKPGEFNQLLQQVLLKVAQNTSHDA
jgi:pimeloyl-ACP methyl ester carboxylesterase